MLTMVLRNSGASKLTLLIFGTIIAAVVYSAFQILPFYYSYFELLNQMEAHTRIASTESDEEIRKRLWYHIKKLEIPCDPEDLKITRADGKMKISMQYKEEYYLTWEGKDYTIHIFDFDATVERTY